MGKFEIRRRFWIFRWKAVYCKGFDSADPDFRAEYGLTDLSVYSSNIIEVNVSHPSKLGF